MMHKPLPTEHHPYFSKYIALVEEGDYTTLLNSNTGNTVSFFESIPADKHDYRYADGKWTIKEVLMHMIDTERVFSYRALAAIRGDNQSLLPSMDENSYADNADVSNRTMQDLLEEFTAIRTGTLKLYAHITKEHSTRTANVNSIATSARAIGYMLIGHVIHHINIIRERYL